MRNNVKKNIERESIAGAISAQRTKIIVAATLISLMAFMWIRLFLHRQAVQTASAAVDKIADANTAAEQVKFRFVELPVIEGRNDRLGRDIFSLENLKAGSESPDGGLRRNSEESVDEMLGEIRADLKLEAIASGKKKEAFINGLLVRKGQPLKIKKNAKLYELDVVSIGDNEVALRYKGKMFTLTLAKPAEPVD
jgi:hypothetical protein